MCSILFNPSITTVGPLQAHQPLLFLLAGFRNQADTLFFSLPFVVQIDPYILPHVQADRGAIRFILSGALLMCPGLTSPGGRLPPVEDAIPADRLVAVHAEGKEHAVAVGITKLGTEDMKKVNKGVAVETATYLGDDLWALNTL